MFHEHLYIYIKNLRLKRLIMENGLLAMPELDLQLDAPPNASFGFKEAVDFCARTHSRDVITAIGADQSAYLFSSLFRETQDEIVMILDSFSGEISGNPIYVAAMRDCLLNNVRISAIFLNTDGPNSESTILQLFKAFSDNTKMYQIDSSGIIELCRLFDEEKSICHFAAFDRDMYRKEVDTKAFISDGSFHNHGENKKLRRIFSSALKFSQPL
jgi:hypothetical protein